MTDKPAIRSVRELGGELLGAFGEGHLNGVLSITAQQDVIDLVMKVLARYDGSMIRNDRDLPVAPLPRRFPAPEFLDEDEDDDDEEEEKEAWAATRRLEATLKSVDNSRERRSFVDHLYPAAEEDALLEGRIVRHWALRTQRSLPEQASLDAILSSIVSRANDAVREAHRSRFSEEKIAGSLVEASALRIDANYCVIAIESPARANAIGNSSSTATWQILKALDEALAVVDLQGVPKSFWAPLR